MKERKGWSAIEDVESGTTQETKIARSGSLDCALAILASYPGRLGGEKRPGVHCMRMRVITQNLGDFAHSRKLS